MKKIIKLYACLLAVLGLTAGCSDYLKEDSGDLLIPEKVEEYAPMLPLTLGEVASRKR